MLFEVWAMQLEAYAESQGSLVAVNEFRSYFDVGMSPEEAYE